jgi:hypothetical protein
MSEAASGAILILPYGQLSFRSSSGSLAKLTARRRASSAKRLIGGVAAGFRAWAIIAREMRITSSGGLR